MSIAYFFKKCNASAMLPKRMSTLIKNLRATLQDAIQHPQAARAVVIFDTQSELAQLITAGYRAVLPSANFVDFDTVTQEDIRAVIDSLSPRDIVILVQSTNFRLNDFRFRIELFQRKLATIEHVHLARMQGDEMEIYINALAYDSVYYHHMGHELKKKIDAAKKIEVLCKGTSLLYDTEMEPAKLNIGDYSEMNNIGGSFPIGEVFSEAKDFLHVNGDILICAFAGEDHMVKKYTPFVAHIEAGVLRAPTAPEEFQKVLEMIRVDEPVLVREFGLGLNRAMDTKHIVSDITAFERMNGLHLSLGAKHGVYKKAGLKTEHNRYHVDIFVDVEKIILDGDIIFENREYSV